MIPVRVMRKFASLCHACVHNTDLSAHVSVPGCSGKTVPQVYEHPGKFREGPSVGLERGVFAISLCTK